MRDEKIYSGTTDWGIILIYFLLAAIGILSVYSSTYDSTAEGFDIGARYGKQLLWLAFSLVAGWFLFLFDARFFSVFAWVFYIMFLALLVAVLIAGKEMFGSKSWISVGGFSLQPSELAKLGTALALARYLSNYGVNLKFWKHRIRSLIIVIIPMVLVVLQGDAGSALVYLCFLLVLYREGLPGYILVIGVATVAIFILTLIFGPVPVLLSVAFLSLLIIALNYSKRQLILLVLIIFGGVAAASYSVNYVFQNVLKDHQKKRILVTLKMLDDPKGIGYNVTQSKIAIGSGGLLGKGYLQGTQTKGDFVPEQSTDFIFCTIGEEFGLLGSWILVLLYTLLIVRIFFVAERQKNKFSRVYCYSVGAILFMHFFINIGMAIDLMPVIGIPLPFISYGGSSLFAFTMLLFLLIRLDANRDNELSTISN